MNTIAARHARTLMLLDLLEYQIGKIERIVLLDGEISMVDINGLEGIVRELARDCTTVMDG